MRLRSTALPTCRVTVKPNRGSSLTWSPSPLPRSLASSTKAGVAQRAPLRMRWNSARVFSVTSRESEPAVAFAIALAAVQPAALTPTDACGPLRAAVPPPGVRRPSAMRLRKPWRRLRTSLLGW